MDFSYTAGQKLIKKNARKFLSQECPSDLVREMETDVKGFSSKLWEKMAELGWMGLIFPEEYGGSGLSFFDLIVLVEEMGRHLVPVPFLETVILGGLTVLFRGNEEQKRNVVSKIATGGLILTMALTELQPAHGATGVDFRVKREGDRFILDGKKLFMPYADSADYLVCAAPSEQGQGRTKHEGITLFLIDGKQSNIHHTLLETIAQDRQCETLFDKVALREGSIIGEYNEGAETLSKVLAFATVAQCASMVGGAQKVLEMTLAHAKSRNQFKRPIASFQVIQHRCANMIIDLEGAKFATYEAAWKITNGFPCVTETSIAKAWVNQAYNRICDSGHQILGGSGLMKEYDMALFSRRAKAAEFYLGDTQFHKDIIAKQLEL